MLHTITPLMPMHKILVLMCIDFVHTYCAGGVSTVNNIFNLIQYSIPSVLQDQIKRGLPGMILGTAMTFEFRQNFNRINTLSLWCGLWQSLHWALKNIDALYTWTLFSDLQLIRNWSDYEGLKHSVIGIGSWLYCISKIISQILNYPGGDHLIYILQYNNHMTSSIDLLDISFTGFPLSIFGPKVTINYTLGICTWHKKISPKLKFTVMKKFTCYLLSVSIYNVPF